MKQISTLFTVLILLLFTAAAAAQCPPLGFPEPADDCATAPILCEDLDGYCATLSNNNISQPFPGCPGFALNNDDWFAFYAGSTTITIEIIPSNCLASPPTTGMQAAIYDGCNGPAMATQCDCSSGPIILSSSNYVVGQIYWIVVDGCGGDVCDFEVNVTTGSTVGNPPLDPGNIAGDQSVCQGDVSSYNVAPVTGATEYNWTLSPPIGTITNNGPVANVTWALPGTANLCLDVANQCFANGNQVCYSINIAPSPAANAVPPMEITCTNSEVQLNGAGSSTGPNFSYQWTGPGIVSGGNTLTPTVDQSGVYTLTVTNTSTGCISDHMITVNENTTPPIANAGPPLELNCAVPQLPLVGFGSSVGPPGFSYQWTTMDGNIVGPTNAINTLVNAPGTYTITVTNLQNGCTSEASTVVGVNADTPIADPGPDVTIGCGASQVILDGSNSTTGASYDYVWITNNGNIVSGGDTPTPTVDQSGTYTLVVVNSANGCIDSSSVMVVIDNTPPTVAIANPGDISCLDPSLILDATGSSTGANFSYVWTTGDGNIVGGGSTLEPEIDLAGTYTLTITNNDNGCVEDATVTVSGDVIAPMIDIAAPPVLSCTAPEVMLDAGGSSTGANFSYAWTTADGTIVSGGTSATPTVSAAGTYTLTITNTDNDCAVTEAVTVMIDADQPVIMLDPVDELNCTLTELTLNADISGGQNLSFTWTTADGNFVSGTNTLNPVVDQAGTYEITVINNDNGCEESSSVTVTIDNALPTVAIANPGDISCLSPSLILDATASSAGGNFSYQWTTGDGNIVGGGATLEPEIDLAGTYTLTITNTDNGCVEDATVTVSGDVIAPTIDIAAPPILTCSDPQVLLDAGGSSAGANFSYAWTTADGTIVSGGTSATPTVGAAGTYELTITNTDNDCVSTETVVVDIDVTQPVILLDPVDELNCTLTEFALNADISGGQNLSFSWTTTDGNFVSGATTLTPLVDQPGTYAITVINDDNGCEESTSVTVSQDALVPQTDAGPDGELTCSVLDLQLDGSNSDGGASILYQWSTGDGNIVSGANSNTAQVDGPGTYILETLNTDNTCTSSDTVVVTENVTVIDAQIVPPVLMGCNNPVINLDGSASSAGATLTYTWTTADGSILSGEDTPVLEIDGPGTYNLLVYNTDNDCFDEEATLVIQNLDVPVVDAGPGGAITCTVTSVALQGTAGGATQNFIYQWTTTDGNIAAGNSTLTPTVDLEGTYLLTVTDTVNQCTATSTVDVIQDADVPITSIVSSNPFDCNFTTVTLDGSASTTGPNLEYTWSTADGNILNFPDPLTAIVDQPGSYTLLINDTVSFCMSTSTFQVMPDTISPSLSIVLPEVLTCETTEVVLDAAAGGLPNISINWNTANGNIVADENTFNPTVNQAGTYSLTITNNDNGCASTTDVDVMADVALPIVDAGATAIVDCNNPEITLNGTADAGGAMVDYAWSTLDGNILTGLDTPTPTVDAGGTYTLTATNTENGCVNTSEVTITQDQVAPTVDPGLDGLLNCFNPSIQLDGSASSAGAAFAYTWSTLDGNIVSGADTPMPTVDGTGTYILTINNTINGCVSSDTVAVTDDFEVPQVDAGAEATLNCIITSTMLNGTASTGPEFTYTWTTLDGNIVAGANTLTPEIDLPGTYVLTVVDTENGCSAFSSVMAMLDADFPVAVATADDPLTCAVTQVALDGTGTNVGSNFTYSWTTPDGNIVSGATTLDPTVDLPGTYTLTVLNIDNECETTTDVLVQIDTLAPAAEAGLTNLLTCEIVQLNLDGTGSAAGANFGYQWSTTDGNILSGASTIDPLIDEPGTYQIQVTDNANGCTSTDVVTIAQDVELPTVAAAANAILTCDLTSLSLSGAGSSTGAEFMYNWTTTDGNILSGGTTLDPQVNEPGTYTLTIEDDSNGCVSQTSVVVEQDVVPPTVAIASPNLLTCANTTVPISGTGSSSGASFMPLWSTLDGNILSGANTLNIQANQPGTYTLFIENEDNGCTAQADIVLGQDIEEPVVDAGLDFILPCDEDVTALNGSATANSSNLQIEWTTPDGTLENNTNSFNAGVSSAGTYLLTVINLDNGCMGEDNLLITEDNPTDPDLEVEQPLCSDDFGALEVTGVEAGSPPYSYSIDGGVTFYSSPVFTGLEGGDYSVIVQDALGCESDVVSSTIVQPDPIEILTEDHIEVLQGDSYQLNLQLLNADPSAVDTVIWTPSIGLSCVDCLDPIANPLNTTTYKVEVILYGECRSTTQFTLFVDERPIVYVPNAFSPNDDGTNDLFYLFGRTENIARIRSFVVFDRWGETVHNYFNFQPNDPASGWDGNFRGSKLNSGVFVWYAEIEMIDGRVEIFEGDVTLVR